MFLPNYLFFGTHCLCSITLFTQMGYSVLHLAAELGHTPILSTLLSESVSIDRLQRTALGNTALHLAVASGVRKSVAKLLQHSKADIDVPDPVRFYSLIPEYAHYCSFALQKYV